VSPAARKPAWDVQIVAAAKGRADHGHRPRSELERLGLRVKLDLVPRPSVSDLPADVIDDAKRAAVLVALIAVREQVGGELRESVGYLLASAPGLAGRHGVPGSAGTGLGENEVEAGLISGDLAELAELAERIAARVGRL
jgi:hypothetical protein